MKQVLAIIRPEKWQVVREILSSMDIDSATQNRVLGRGRQRGLRYLRRSSEESEGDMQFLPKRMITCYVPDEKLDALVSAVVRANQTGNYGDGKIFVIPLENHLFVNSEDKKVKETVA